MLVPIDTAAAVIKQLRARGRVFRPYLGLAMVNASTLPTRAVRATTTTTSGEDELRRKIDAAAHLLVGS
jgi:hypothetical protein